MIKILNTQHCICRDCGCEFTFEEEDVSEDYEESPLPFGGAWKYTYVECPICRHKITL